MKLILFRHGIAMDREEAFQQKVEDSKRPLTEKGRQRTEMVSNVLADWGEKIDLLVTSPLLRAHQTSQVLIRQLKPQTVQESAELVPSAPPQAFAQWLRTHSHDATAILAVGHEPQLSVFATWILTGNTNSVLDIKKSGMLCLQIESFDQVDARSAELLWLVQPKQLIP